MDLVIMNFVFLLYLASSCEMFYQVGLQQSPDTIQIHKKRCLANASYQRQDLIHYRIGDRLE